jgi:hypothetical protein
MNIRCTINAAGNIANLPSGVVVKLDERCMKSHVVSIDQTLFDNSYISVNLSEISGSDVVFLEEMH